MDDALLMRRVERVGDLPCDLQRLLLRQTTGDPLFERIPLHQLEDQRTCAAGFLEAIDRSDMWVIERGEDARLSLEAREPIGVAGKRRWQNLDRDVASKPVIRC